MIVMVDVDDVCADLISRWLLEYNRDYRDYLRPQDIIEWDIEKFVSPKCGNKILDYIENPNMYDYIHPVLGSQVGIIRLRRMGHRVIFTTASTNGSAGRKLRWLNDHGYECNKMDYFECHDKSLIKANIMIDDAIHNINNFSGLSILYARPWNELEQKNSSGFLIAENWEKVVNCVKFVIEAAEL